MITIAKKPLNSIKDGSPHFPQPLNMPYAFLHCIIYFFFRSETTNSKSKAKENHY